MGSHTRGELYSFQEDSVTQIVDAARNKYTSALIADDMGLGKTVQAIEIDRRKRLAANDRSQTPGRQLTLVVAPLSVLGVWKDHFEKWNPSLKVYVIDPKSRINFERHVKAAAASPDGRGQFDVFICHWEALRLVPELQKVPWFHIIADEVQRAKSRKTQQTVALKKIRAEHKLGLSGTPADDKPQDFWSILNWLYPRTFTSFWRFFNYHCLVLYHDETGSQCGCLQKTGKGHKRAYREVVGTANEKELHRQIKPYYVRRLKEDVLDELPDKYYETIPVELTQQQRRAYNEMRKSMLAWVGEHEDQPLAAPVVISQLVRLQQFACAFGGLETVTKKKRNCQATTCTLAGGCQGHPVTRLRLMEPSSKLDVVMQLVLDNPERQIVVFGQSKQVINMLGSRLAAKGIPAGLLTGDTPQKDRDSLVAKFQAGRLRVFAGTIAAGGVGITLTAASTVVFLDRAWSPSVNRQAEDRLHRLGQKNAVQVIDLVARDTVDLGRLQRIKQKWSFIRAILGDDPDVQDRFLQGIEDLEDARR